jgi:hypothetical protein
MRRMDMNNFFGCMRARNNKNLKIERGKRLKGKRGEIQEKCIFTAYFNAKIN